MNIGQIHIELEKLRIESHRLFTKCQPGLVADYHAKKRDLFRDMRAALPPDETCNGWRNHETDMIAKQVTNHPRELWAILATSYTRSKTHTPAQALQALADGMKGDFIRTFEVEPQGLMADMANAALARVDWRALADHMLREAVINPTPASSPRDWSTVKPFAAWTRIRSHAGENDDGDDGPRETGPNAEGEIDWIGRHDTGEPYYAVAFPLSGVRVFLDHSELENPELYKIL